MVSPGGEEGEKRKGDEFMRRFQLGKK